MTDDKVRLSESRLWAFQREFYAREGAEAWDGKVPSYVTSNAFIAHAHASVLLRFMAEHAARGGPDDEPFHIIELGAGPGRFGFLLLQELTRLRAELGLSHVRFVHVMTDFADKNIGFWREHPALRPHIAAGTLGLARFEIGASDRLEVELAAAPGARILEPARPLSRPLIVIANYVFDSLPCDIFRLCGGRLEEGLTRPNIRPNPAGGNNLAEVMDRAGFDFTYRPAALPYYGDPLADAVLAGYREELGEASFLFPVGAVGCLRDLLRLTRGGLFVMATDKGYGRHHRTFMASPPDIVLHDTAFSLSVNFHALGEYARRTGGSCHHQRHQSSTVTTALTLDLDLDAHVETRRALARHIDEAGHAHLFHVHTLLDRSAEQASTEELVSLLCLLRWDPVALNRCIDVLIARASRMSPVALAELAEGMARSAELFYVASNGFSLANNIGAFFQAAGLHEVALAYYRRARDEVGRSDFLCYNMGLCHYFLGAYELALAELREALSLGYQDNVLLKGWIVQTQEELAKSRA